MLDRGPDAVRVRHLLSRGRRHDVRGEAHHLRRPAPRTSSRSSARTGGSTRSGRSPTSTSARSSPTAPSTTPVPHAAQPRGREDRRARVRRPTRSRGWSTGWRRAYLLTGEDRFLEAAEQRHRVPARAHAHGRRRTRASSTGTTASTSRGAQGAEDPRLRVRRRLRRDPGLRADLRARRPDPDLPRSPATRGSCATST